MRGFVISLLLVAACSFERRSPEFACVSSADCEGGRVCAEHFCVDPHAAGDGGPIHDGAPGDAFVCPAACTSCNGMTCIINCDQDSSCGQLVECPTGMACQISCGRSACGAGINCSVATDCTIGCSGDSSCGGPITCGTGACDVSCSGTSSCGMKVDCHTSCKCDTHCLGTGSCPATPDCPGPNSCTMGNSCTSAPNQCHGTCGG